MRIKKIQIKNFKSLVDFELEDLKPFCAFVGPNASGKSNIFEALELLNFFFLYGKNASNLFGTKANLLSYHSISQELRYHIVFNDGINIDYGFAFAGDPSLSEVSIVTSIYRDGLVLSDYIDKEKRKKSSAILEGKGKTYENDYEQFIDNFSRLFVGKSQLNRTNQMQSKLLPDASNLSQIIGRVFEDESIKTDFIEWLRIIIPEFKNISIKRSNIDGSLEFFLYEKSSNKPFPKYLISDGTYSILALMAAVYQTDQPQFLCIEEPENGLHPQAIQLLVDFFREKCEEHGHHIWLNTHSQTLVRCMEIDELILVNKVNGETKARQLTKDEEVNLKTDEAWLTNALGGGTLWSR